MTHRLIATRAGVPLGSTTYYFPTLDDLVTAALRAVAEAARAWLESWAERLTVSEDVPATVVALAAEYLADRDRALAGYELYLAAARRAELRPAAELSVDGLRGICARLAGGPEAGAALAALVDGALLRALVTGRPLDAESLRAGAAALLGGRGATRPGTHLS